MNENTLVSSLLPLMPQAVPAAEGTGNPAASTPVEPNAFQSILQTLVVPGQDAKVPETKGVAPASILMALSDEKLPVESETGSETTEKSVSHDRKGESDSVVPFFAAAFVQPPVMFQEVNAAVSEGNLAPQGLDAQSLTPTAPVLGDNQDPAGATVMGDGFGISAQTPQDANSNAVSPEMVGNLSAVKEPTPEPVIRPASIEPASSESTAALQGLGQNSPIRGQAAVVPASASSGSDSLHVDVSVPANVKAIPDNQPAGIGFNNGNNGTFLKPQGNPSGQTAVPVGNSLVLTEQVGKSEVAPVREEQNFPSGMTVAVEGSPRPATVVDSEPKASPLSDDGKPAVLTGAPKQVLTNPDQSAVSAMEPTFAILMGDPDQAPKQVGISGNNPVPTTVDQTIAQSGREMEQQKAQSIPAASIPVTEAPKSEISRTEAPAQPGPVNNTQTAVGQTGKSVTPSKAPETSNQADPEISGQPQGTTEKLPEFELSSSTQGQETPIYNTSVEFLPREIQAVSAPDAILNLQKTGLNMEEAIQPKASAVGEEPQTGTVGKEKDPGAVSAAASEVRNQPVQDKNAVQTVANPKSTVVDPAILAARQQVKLPASPSAKGNPPTSPDGKTGLNTKASRNAPISFAGLKPSKADVPTGAMQSVLKADSISQTNGNVKETGFAGLTGIATETLTKVETSELKGRVAGIEPKNGRTMGKVESQSKADAVVPVTNTPAAQVQTPAVTETPSKTVTYEPKQVLDQIVHGTHVMVRDGAVQMHLKLDPPELGRVELRIAVEQDGMKAHFVTESQTVKAIIETNLPHLRNALQQAGVQADQLSVTVGGRWAQGGNNGSGFTGRENHPFYAPTHRYANDSADEPLYRESESANTLWMGRINLKA